MHPVELFIYYFVGVTSLLWVVYVLGRLWTRKGKGAGMVPTVTVDMAQGKEE